MTTATTTDEALDLWAGSSGLADDFDATITEAYFGTDAAYNNGETVLLILTLETDIPDVPVITEKLSTGTGWEITDGGAGVADAFGKSRAFNKDTRVQRFISAMLALDGVGAALRAKGSPMQAKTYEGLSFHWNRRPVVGFDGTTKDVLLPTAYLPEAGTAPTAAAPAAPVDAPTGVDPVLKAKLTAAAKKAADFNEFIELGFSIDGVVGNADAEAIVADEAQYVALKG